jgi:integrase
MSRRSEGPHLWERPARYDRAGNLTHRAAWFVVDRTVQRSTGLGVDATADQKEKALNAYLTSKHVKTFSVGSRDPSQIALNDVLAKYLRDKERPYETKLRVAALRKFWNGKLLSEVTGDTCRAYAATRTRGAARRELEDFRAAINHHRTEGLHDKIVSVVLPDKSEPRERWLTRQEAAQLIRAAWRYREVQNFRSTDRHTRRHVAKFMLVASYMGSRAGVICSASIEAKRPKGRSWIDLTNGGYYGRPAGERQTNKRKQTERVPPALLAHLRRWRARGQRYVVEWNGAPIKRISKAHAAAVTDAGFESDVTPHTWRHCAATWLLQRGKRPVDIADFLGMTVDVLMRVYGHHSPHHAADLHKR